MSDTPPPSPSPLHTGWLTVHGRVTITDPIQPVLCYTSENILGEWATGPDMVAPAGFLRDFTVSKAYAWRTRDAVLVAGSRTLESKTANFNAGVIGYAVEGEAVAPGSIIESVQSDSKVTLNQPAILTSPSATVRFSKEGDWCEDTGYWGHNGAGNGNLGILYPQPPKDVVLSVRPGHRTPNMKGIRSHCIAGQTAPAICSGPDHGPDNFAIMPDGTVQARALFIKGEPLEKLIERKVKEALFMSGPLNPPRA